MPFEPGHKLTTGRPKGARNKRTVRMEQVRAKTTEPLTFLHQGMNDATQELALRIDCARYLLPYFHKRQAVAVDVDMTAKSNLCAQLELVYGVTADDVRPVQDTAPLQRLARQYQNPVPVATQWLRGHEW